MDARVHQLILHLSANLQIQLSTAAMGHLVNLSASHLAHLFKREAAMSPQQFLKHVRLQHARLLLQSTFLSIKEIMVRSGFNDASHFVRDFKRAYGQTPSQYRTSYMKAWQTSDNRGGQYTAGMANEP